MDNVEDNTPMVFIGWFGIENWRYELKLKQRN